jgi:hypothetical protein
MTPANVNAALPLLGTVGVMGLFMPSIETAWNAGDGGEEAGRVRKGERVYVGAAVVVGLAASYAQGNPTPILLCAGFAILVVAMYEHALRNAC